jgi:uncharacterized protein YegP (UPF0339 family)
MPYIDFYDIYPSNGRIDIIMVPDGYITNASKGKGIEYLKLNNAQGYNGHM